MTFGQHSVIQMAYFSRLVWNPASISQVNCQSCASSSGPGHCSSISSRQSYCVPHQKQYAYLSRRYASTTCNLSCAYGILQYTEQPQDASRTFKRRKWVASAIVSGVKTSLTCRDSGASWLESELSGRSASARICNHRRDCIAPR